LEGHRIHPEKEKWYQQTGLGMGQTLNVAAEKKAYPWRTGEHTWL
jgi:tungstate transport system substrate-binding protein